MTTRPDIREPLFGLMDSSRSAREGETALSSKRKGGSPAAAAKEGARGGTMGFPTLNLAGVAA